MRKFFALLLIQLLLGSQLHAAFSWYRTITIDHTKVPADLTNFPMLFSGTYAYLAVTGSGGKVEDAQGDDIGFYSNANCSTGKLDWKVKLYTSTTGAVAYWVEIPSVSSSVDTVVYLCYTDTGVTTDQSNPTGVWDSNYKLVLDFPDGTTLSVADSTSNGNNGTNVGATATSGKIPGGAASFDGTNDTITRALDLSGSALVLVEFWLNKSSFANDDDLALEFTANGATTQGGFAIDPNSASGTFEIFANNGAGTPYKRYTRPSTGARHYCAGFDFGHATTSVRDLYIDGAVQTPTDQSNVGASVTAANSTLYLMSRNNTSLFAAGVMDHFRLSSGTLRSASWCTASYNSQNDPATFYTVGSETAVSGGSSTRRRVVITQ